MRHLIDALFAIDRCAWRDAMLLLLLLDKRNSKREVVRGCVADFCPACRCARIFRYEATEVAKGPFRQGWEDTDQRAICKTCDTRLWVGNSFARIDDPASTLTEVITRTNPGLPAAIAERDNLHKQVKAKPMDMTLRAAALNDAFQCVARMIKPESLGNRIAEIAALIILAPFLALMACLCVPFDAIHRATRLDREVLAIAVVSALFLLVLSGSIWVSRFMGRLRRRKCHQMAGTLLGGFNIPHSDLRDAAEVLRPEFSNMLRYCSARVVADRMMHGIRKTEAASPHDGIVEVAA